MQYILNFLFSSSSRSNRRKELRTLWLALALGLFAALVIGAVLYVLNRQGRV